MRVAVTGATGNIGINLVQALAADPEVEEVVGIARRRPFLEIEGVRWLSADVATDDLGPALDGVDVVVHLAWLIQPSRDAEQLRKVNVEGSRRVFDAARAAGASAIVHASSVAAYSRGPKDEPVDESWPTCGVPSSTYSQHKSDVERVLDGVEAIGDLRVVRLRPGLVLQRAAGSEIHRLFLGPLVPRGLVRRRLVPIVPRLRGLRFQAVHSKDVAEAFRRATLSADAAGAYNVAAEPVIDADELGRAIGARPVSLPVGPVRALVDITWRLRLQPTGPGWLDLLLSVPVMDVSRAREELGWRPVHSSTEAVVQLLDGIRDGAGHGTPPLQGAPLPSRD